MSDVVKSATIMCAFLDLFDHGQVIMKIAPTLHFARIIAWGGGGFLITTQLVSESK